jgi:hypothetical protein
MSYRSPELPHQQHQTLLLLSKLLDENRLDDLLRIIEDDEYMEQLMREFNIL